MSRLSQIVFVMNQDALFSNYEWSFYCDSLYKDYYDFPQLRRDYKKRLKDEQSDQGGENNSYQQCII
jgi:hypothetical protein